MIRVKPKAQKGLGVVRTGKGRGAYRVAVSAMALMCPGVDPQHPPIMFTRPANRGGGRVRREGLLSIWSYSARSYDWCQYR